MPSWWRGRNPFRRRSAQCRVALAVGVVLTVGLLPQYAPSAEAEGLGRPGLQDTGDPVRGKNAKSKPHQSNPAEKAEVKRPAKTVWPTPGTDEIHIGTQPAKANGLPLRVRKPKTDAQAGRRAGATRAEPAAESVKVEVVSRKRATAAGIDGVLLKVARTDDGTKSGAAHLQLDYSGFAGAYGGNYGSRLRFVEYPECLLTTPEEAKCHTPRELPSNNNPAARTLAADVPVAPAARGPRTQLKAAATTAPGTHTLLAATAGPSSGQGSYGASPLSPSAEWSVSNSSGAFNWSYPLRTPPVPGGLAPSVSFGYNSQSVDGETAATNNQGSWIGQGFGYEPGFIERRYKSCADDGHADTNGDQCWAYDNATIQIAGGPSAGWSRTTRPASGASSPMTTPRSSTSPEAPTRTTTVSTGGSPPPTAPSTPSVSTACPVGPRAKRKPTPPGRFRSTATTRESPATRRPSPTPTAIRRGAGTSTTSRTPTAT